MTKTLEEWFEQWDKECCSVPKADWDSCYIPVSQGPEEACKAAAAEILRVAKESRDNSSRYKEDWAFEQGVDMIIDDLEAFINSTNTEGGE